MFTGKHLPGHGVYRLHDILPRDEVCFTERLRLQGYHTALFGKMHVSGRMYEEAQRHPNDGFDVYEWCLEPMLSMDSPFNGYAPWLKAQDPDFYDRLKSEGRGVLHHPQELHMTHWAADRTIDYIASSTEDGPFFCMMSVFDPHNPYEDYPLEMLERVDKGRIPPPTRRAADDTRPFGIVAERDHSYLGPFSSFSGVDLATMRLGYYASVALIDFEIGRVLDCLNEQKLADNTIVVFTSDHGDMLGDHELLVKGAFFYDACSRVPLIIRWPGQIPASTRNRELVQLHDLAATALTAAGCAEDDIARWMPDAIDLTSVARGGCGHRQAVCCYRNSGICDNGGYWDPEINATMYRSGSYKLNVFHNAGNDDTVGELYDMENDPEELRNLWHLSNYGSVRQAMTEDLMQWLVQRERDNGPRGGEAVPGARQRLVNSL